MHQILGLWFWFGLLLCLSGIAGPGSWAGWLIAPVALFVVFGVLRAGWWLLSPPHSRR